MNNLEVDRLTIRYFLQQVSLTRILTPACITAMDVEHVCHTTCISHIGTQQAQSWLTSQEVSQGWIQIWNTYCYKNCYTAPPSLTNALISALGATTELFATPFDANPKMKYFSAPFAEDAEFGARPDSISFIWQGSCHCHPEFSDVQMLKTLQWALACASIQTELLLVTLLLQNRESKTIG